MKLCSLLEPASAAVEISNTVAGIAQDRGLVVQPTFNESVHIARSIHEVATAKEVDLKVIATRGRSQSSAILLGSVAEGVIVEWQSQMSPPAWPSKPNRRKVLIDGMTYEINV